MNRKWYILITAILLGLLIVTQVRSYREISGILDRDSIGNSFGEIQVLKDKNDDLRKETNDLENALDQLADQNLALKVIEDEVVKYNKLTGDKGVFGQGVTVSIDSKIETLWIVDIVNELFSASAQAVSINGIRITPDNLGFDTIPNGNTMISGTTISPPYEFRAIGNTSVLVDVLSISGGILSRIESVYPKIKISLSEKEIVQID